jgi:hypothetical protein
VPWCGGIVFSCSAGLCVVRSNPARAYGGNFIYKISHFALRSAYTSLQPISYVAGYVPRGPPRPGCPPQWRGGPPPPPNFRPPQSESGSPPFSPRPHPPRRGGPTPIRGMRYPMPPRPGIGPPRFRSPYPPQVSILSNFCVIRAEKVSEKILILDKYHLNGPKKILTGNHRYF